MSKQASRYENMDVESVDMRYEKTQLMMMKMIITIRKQQVATATHLCFDLDGQLLDTKVT